jgi:hypothetical protein
MLLKKWCFEWEMRNCYIDAVAPNLEREAHYTMPIKPDEPELRRVSLDFAADEVITQIRLSHRFDDLNALCREDSEESTESLLNELNELVNTLNNQQLSEPPVPNPRR